MCAFCLCAVMPLCELLGDDEKDICAAVERSLPLLQQGAKTFRERSEGQCISCHHQGLVLQTVSLARESGFAVDEMLAKEEVERVHGFYARRQARYEAALLHPETAGQADPFGNFTVHAGYWLWGLAEEKVPANEALATAVRLFASKQWSDGRWSFADVARAPMQASDLTTTALAARALGHYPPTVQRDEMKARIEKARQWLEHAEARTTDEMAFRLYGLHWAGAEAVKRTEAVAQLSAAQRGDGGWGQQENMPPDAYATGLALVTLARAGGQSSADATFRRGVDFLLARQNPDGSWYVKTRAIPTNPYFESGFPHGKSQFISYAATCWATMALTLAAEPRSWK